MNDRQAFIRVVPTIEGKVNWHSHQPRPDAIVCRLPVHADMLVWLGITKRQDMDCGLGVEGKVIVGIIT
jgi:hypothetical protein